MSDDRRPTEVNDWGSGGDRPGRLPLDRNGLLLHLIALGVLVAAACSAVTAWTVLEMREDERVINCFYYVGIGFGDPDEAPEYDDLNDAQRAVIDRLDCDVPGR